MGIKGSDASVEESDIVLLNDDPYKIIEAKQIAKKTKNRCIFNIVFALIIKAAVMVLAILSLVDMWLAVVADTGLLIILIISSILLIKAKVKK
jgi:Cd2+/Zn2+-exporting ATPase